MSEYGITRAFIMSRSNSRDIARPRQVVMYLCREFEGMTFPEVARLLDKDPTTIIHGVNSVKNTLAREEQVGRPLLTERIDRIKATLGEPYQEKDDDAARISRAMCRELERVLRAQLASAPIETMEAILAAIKGMNNAKSTDNLG